MKIQFQFDAGKGAPKVWRCVATGYDSGRQPLDNVLVERASDTHIRLIAADGFLMAIASYPVTLKVSETPEPLPQFGPFFIPPEALARATNLPKSNFTTVLLDTDARTTTASIGSLGQFVQSWPESLTSLLPLPWRNIATTALKAQQQRVAPHIALRPQLMAKLAQGIGATETVKFIAGGEPSAPVFALGNSDYSAWGLVMPMFVGSGVAIPAYVEAAIGTVQTKEAVAV